MCGVWQWSGGLLVLVFAQLVFLFYISHDVTEEILYRGDGDLGADTDYAFEPMEYMHGLTRGTAHIRPVVEQEHTFREYRGCWGDRPVVGDGWVEMDGVFGHSAFFDPRNSSLFPGRAVVQLLSMSFRSPSGLLFCRLLWEDGSESVVEGVVREIWQRGWDPRSFFYVPLLVTCPLPRTSAPMAVQVSRSRCSNGKKAVSVAGFPHVEKKKVAVCVKGMDFQHDHSERLVEWLEAQFMLGADVIAIYVYSIHPRMVRILSEYALDGKVKLIQLMLPGNSPNVPMARSAYIARNRQQKRRHELIPYNHCLYSHMGTHEWVLVVDSDEVVVPLRHDSWSSLLDDVVRNHPNHTLSSVSIRNVFKFSSDGHLLKTLNRSRAVSRSGDYGKSFTSTSSVASVFNHFALHRLSSSVLPTVHLPPDVALKLHYKSSCPVESRHECAELHRETVRDDSLDRFADRLRERIRRAAERCGFSSPY